MPTKAPDFKFRRSRIHSLIYYWELYPHLCQVPRAKSLESHMSSWYYSEGFLPLSQGSMAEFGGSELWGDLPDSADQTIATQPWKMSDTRRIHETEWEAHKEEIKALYLTQNKTRGEVMAAMERLMGFKPGLLPFLHS
jgi:hypothetical protein